MRDKIPSGFKYIENTGYSIIAREDIPGEHLKEVFSETGIRKKEIERGRGDVGIVNLEGVGKCVVKHYRRGGLLRHINKDLFLAKNRILDELKGVLQARRGNVPVPAILAVFIIPAGGLFYRFKMLNPFLENSEDLLTFLETERDKEKRRKAMREAGTAAGRMHRTGVYHGDLNAGNFLVTKKGVYLLDFDRAACYEELPEPGARDNLARLFRSFRKAVLKGMKLSADEKLVFLEGYAGQRNLDIDEIDYFADKTYPLRRIWWKAIGEIQ